MLTLSSLRKGVFPADANGPGRKGGDTGSAGTSEGEHQPAGAGVAAGAQCSEF